MERIKVAYNAKFTSLDERGLLPDGARVHGSLDAKEVVRRLLLGDGSLEGPTILVLHQSWKKKKIRHPSIIVHWSQEDVKPHL